MGETERARAVQARVLRRFDIDPSIKLLIAGLLLPNALSLATLMSLVDVGLPPRPAAMMLYCVLAISARKIPFAMTVALFLGILAFDLVGTISLMFGLAPTELMVALEHARRINMLASPLYVGMIVSIALTTAASLMLLARREDVVRGNAVMLFAATLVLVVADLVSNTSAHFDFNTMFGRDKPIVSASEVSGFRTVAGVNGRNVVVVVVESLGYFNNPLARARIAAPLNKPRVTDKYVVTSGTAQYYGSTTSGEMRELCSTRARYADFARESGTDCLPSKLHRLGYSTLAVHGFSQDMFERREWYPEIGFDKAVFGESLLSRVTRRCGSAFRSVCDADLAPVIAKEAAYVNSPRFIYWLTLNTHIPVGPGDALTNYDCELKPDDFGTVHVCRMAELWHDLFGSIARLALEPAIGPAEILIVGDHAPPLWSKRGRGQFMPGKVAWYRLTPR
ncbi:sulfatase-like hydrolase/transferase [Bradyrhizobium prioriisuperbiae]|uniref:sulfatase-like hydrolase/transferase n=1 Tax=Bradyrhizobium prioriisuperbiae TaxID=2854389 RepID=UPI0028E878FC|nr:sulfatase-like hydrolase/transferase [Bradyrhizobium prioritasuperba]